MKKFAKLFFDLEQTEQTGEKVDLMLHYFRSVSDEDKLWMIALFTGRRPKRVASSALQREWATELAGIPIWLFDECYGAVGDLSETISLLLPDPVSLEDHSLAHWINYIIALEGRSEDERKESTVNAWNVLSKQERFIFNKIISSTFRVTISQNLVVRALSLLTGMNSAGIMSRIMGKWNAENISLDELLGNGQDESSDISVPYPFLSAHPLEGKPESIGDPKEWVAEWKWDGIRVQIIKRGDLMFIWSKGEELLTGKFPEFNILQTNLPDGIVLDGEILPYANEKILSFGVLQNRIGKKNLNGKILSEAPVVFFAYDILEYNGEDIREKTLIDRRDILNKLIREVDLPVLHFSKEIEFSEWEELNLLCSKSRDYSAEGLMLKRKDSSYKEDTENPNWHKWKTDPLTAHAVLIYAQTGTGKRANLYSEYTFGVWKDGQLVSFTKANSGLSDKEVTEIDKWVRENAIEKFGPVRTVKPTLVFEIGFEGIQASNRHKSGIVLRAPHILRWRMDKKIDEADTLETLKGILKSSN